MVLDSFVVVFLNSQIAVMIAKCITSGIWIKQTFVHAHGHFGKWNFGISWQKLVTKKIEYFVKVLIVEMIDSISGNLNIIFESIQISRMHWIWFYGNANNHTWIPFLCMVSELSSVKHASFLCSFDSLVLYFYF